jgi:hypothetical protein
MSNSTFRATDTAKSSDWLLHIQIINRIILVDGT